MDYSYVEVMKNKNRMCETLSCSMCRLSSYNNERDGRSFTCSEFCKDYPEEAQDIIMKWAEEHKVKTNLDVFCETFGVGKEEVDTYSCPLYDCDRCGNICKGCKYLDWWRQEYKGKEV